MVEELINTTIMILGFVFVLALSFLATKKPSTKQKLKTSMEVSKAVEESDEIIKDFKKVTPNIEKAIINEEEITEKAERYIERLMQDIKIIQKAKKDITEEKHLEAGRLLREICLNHENVLRNIQNNLRNAQDASMRIYRGTKSRENKLRNATEELTNAQKEAYYAHTESKKEEKRIWEEEHHDRLLIEYFYNIVKKNKKIHDELGSAAKQCTHIIDIEKKILKLIEQIDDHQNKNQKYIEKNINEIEKVFHKIILALKLAIANQKEIKDLLKNSEKEANEEIKLAA
jgi:hypothetical protein